MSTKPEDHDLRIERAGISLDGLSIGDAFGECFFAPGATRWIEARKLRLGPWRYTDDTEMAISIVAVLAQHGEIVQDDLALAFAQRYQAEPGRGYGGTAHAILRGIGEGGSWRTIAREVFSGMGSMGNGGAMRVAPLGAYFADDIARAAAEARASAEVTHAHLEGQAGAIAIAVAAAAAWNAHTRSDRGPLIDLMDVALAHTPPSATREGIERAKSLPFTAAVGEAARSLGNGSSVIAPDTVPFALWCAARHAGDFAEALWATVAGLGDMDTTCAIVGGIVALSAPASTVPEAWRRAREALPGH